METKMTLTKGGCLYRLCDPSGVEELFGYDKTVAECHIENCGYIVVDEYDDVVDNEYELEEVYQMLGK